MSRGAFDVIQEMQDEFDDKEDRNLAFRKIQNWKRPENFDIYFSVKFE